MTAVMAGRSRCIEMPKSYTVTGPDGRTYSGTAPDDATQEQILAYVKSNAAQAQQQPAAAQAPQPASQANGLATNAMNGLMLGYNDELGGALEAVIGKARGDKRPISDVYREAQQSQEGQEKQYQADHPIAAAGAEVAGGSLPAFLTAGATRAPAAVNTAEQVMRGVQPASRFGRLMKAGGVGGAYGGASGMGNAEPGHEMEGLGYGTAGGALAGVGFDLGIEAGSAVAGKLAGPLQRMGAYLKSVLGGDAPVPAAPQPKTPSAVQGRFLDAMAADNTTPLATLEQAKQRQRIGKDTSIAEVSGRNVQDLARTTYTLGGEGKEFARKQLDAQTGRAQVERVTRDAEDAMGTKAIDSDQLVDDIGRARTARGNVEYDAARNQPVTGSAELNKMLESTPIYRNVWEGVHGPLREAGGTKLPPLFNDKGKLARSPTVEDIDLIKRGLDGRIYTTQGRAMDDAASYKKPALGAMEDRRREMLETVDPLVPEYATARANSANSIEQQEAVELGRSVIEKGDLGRDITKKLNALTPAQRSLAKKGAMDAIEQTILSAADSGAKNGNVVKSIYGWGYGAKEKQLRALFGDEAYDQFAQRMEAEIAKVELRNYVMGGSQTANKMGDVAATDDALHTAGSAAVDVATGAPRTALQRVMRFGADRTIGYSRAGYTEGTRAEVAKKAFGSDMTEIESFLSGLEKMRLEREAVMTGRRQMTLAAGSAGGLVAGQ